MVGICFVLVECVVMHRFLSTASIIRLFYLDCPSTPNNIRGVPAMRSATFFAVPIKKVAGFLCLALFCLLLFFFSARAGNGEAATSALCQREEELRLRAAHRLRALSRRIRGAVAEDKVSRASLEMELLEVLYELEPRIAASEEEWEEARGAHAMRPCDGDEDDEADDCRPLAELVTVLAVTPGLCEGDAGRLDVVVSLPEAMPTLIGRQAPPLLCNASKPAPGGAGRLLNVLARGAWTPLVLLARDAVRVDEAARLAWLAERVARPRAAAVVAGGAVRDPRGRWSAGCAQTLLRRYALRVTRGHRHAYLGCMRCDELRGPFVVSMRLLREVPFSDSLPTAVLFTDWFLRLKMRNVTVLACPDSMFHVADPAEDDEEMEEEERKKEAEERTPMDEKEIEIDGAEGPSPAEAGREGERRAAWRALATAWNVDRVLVDGRPPMHFTCQEVSVDCRRWSSTMSGLQAPQCCLRETAEALQALDDFAHRHQRRYSLSLGAVLGAVKLASLLPWHPQGVLRLEGGMDGVWLKARVNGSGKAVFDVLGRVFDVAPLKAEPASALPPGLPAMPTRVRLMGLWLCSPFNPGAYARGLYGKGYLKHDLNRQQLHLTENNSNHHRIDGHLDLKCRHRECVTNYHKSGSLDFSVENWVSH